MPRTASAEQVYLPTRAAWRKWLAAHHVASKGVWLVFDKQSAGKGRLPYADAVEEALCFGWIDSTTQPVDETHYKQWFAPRKTKSVWSKLNKDRVARLLEQGLMTEAGLAKVEDAKRTGAWTSLDAVEALTMPDDLTAALARNKTASKHFAAFPPSSRKLYLYWVSQAKRPETRARRVAHVVECASKNQKFRSGNG